MNANGTTPHATEAAPAGRLDAGAIAALGNGATPTESIQERVRRAMVEDGLTQKETAIQSGIGSAIFNQWLQGKYAGDNARQDQKALTWLRGRGERVSMAALLPTPPEYFESETGQKIINHLRYAHMLGDLLTVFGVPGVGKSTAVRYYQRAYANVWVATLTPATTGVVPVLQEICDALQASKGSGARKLAQAILGKVRGTNGLLIIDEAHHANVQALDALRGLHDATGLAIAFVGGPELETKLQSMPQFYSRVGLKLFVTRVLAADVNAQLDAWGITKRDARAFLAAHAQRPGALRGVTKVLRLATYVAASTGATLDTTHIKDAAATLAPQATGEE